MGQAGERLARKALVRATRVAIEVLELRVLLSASFDVTHLTDLREDSNFVDVDGSGVGVAVLDTGIYAQNIDLQQNVVAYYDAVTEPVNTPLLANSVDGAVDNNGHGSHVAGIAASSNPDIGVAYAAQIIAVKVLADPGEAQLGGDPITRGLQWVKLHAQDLNIKVVNLSLGTSADINTITSAVTQTQIARSIKDLEALGITVVAATGNSYAQFEMPGAAFPAAVSTISVANTWSDDGNEDDFGAAYGGEGDRYAAIEDSAAADRLAATTQRSTLANQVAAPGQDIYSTWNGVSSDGGDGLHKELSGTSMAAPFVSGLVALMQDAAKTFGGQYISDPSEILSIIKDSSDVITDYNVADNARYDTINGTTTNLPETGLHFKRVNVEQAIQEVYDMVTAGNSGSNPDPGTETDTDSVRSRATIIPDVNATRTFTYTGNVGMDGQVSVGENDVDLFRINLQTRGNLTVTLSPVPDIGFPVDATIRLFNAAGTQIGRADGNTITMDYPTLTTDVAAPLSTGIYYIGISGQNNFHYNIVTGANAADGIGQGDYNMAVALTNPDPNGVAQGAVDADLTNPDESITDPFGSGRKVTVSHFQGLLGSDQPIVGSTERITVDADVDMFRVIAPDNGKLDVATEAQALYGANAADTYVKVYDENLNLLGENDDVSSTDSDSALSVNVTRGATYYVAVTVFANRSFDAADPYNSRTPNSTPTDKSYDLLLWADNGDTDGTAVTATATTLGTTVTAAIGTDPGGRVGAGTDPSKDVDWYSVTAPQDGLLQFHTTGTGTFAPSMSLWTLDSTGTQITQLDEATHADITRSIRVSAGDQVYVAITGAGNESFNWFAVGSGVGGQIGSYTFSASVLPADQTKALSDNSVKKGTPTPIALGQTLSENLGLDGNTVVGASDIDLYAFTPVSTVTARIRTIANTEDDADTVLRLFDAKGRQLAFNDNATATGQSSRITATFLKGKTYYIGVSGSGPAALSYDPLTGNGADVGSTGTYKIAVEGLAPGSVSLTFGGKNTAHYKDANGHVISLRMSGPGTGELEIDGATPGDFALTVDDTSTDSVLIVGGRTTFGDVRVNGPLKAFKGTGVTMGGNFDVEGSMGDMYLAGATLDSQISANLISTIHAGGDFAGALAISGDLGTFKSSRDLTGGIWTIAGGVQNLTARAATAAWTGNFGGEVGTAKLKSLAGTLSTSDILRLSVSADITAAHITTTAAGILLLTAGSLVNAEIRSAADIDRILVGSSVGSTIFAGVDDATVRLPSTGDAFISTANIGNVTVKSGAFSDTRIAAATIGDVSLRSVTADNGGTAFGLATTQLTSLAVGKAALWNAGAAVGTQLPIGDFVVRILQPAVQTPGDGGDSGGDGTGGDGTDGGGNTGGGDNGGNDGGSGPDPIPN